MKKLLLTVLTLALVLSVASCSGTGNGEDTDTDDIVTTSAADTEVSSPSVPDCDYTYEIKEEIIVIHETEDGRKSTKVLRYPVISGMADEEKQNTVNSIFRDTAERQFILNVPDVDIYVIEDTVFNYEVSEVSVEYFSNSFISVKNSVYSMSGMAMYPECPVYTVNVNLESGEIIDEEVIIGEFNIISSKFIAGDFTMVSGASDLMENTNYEDMILQYKSEYASYPEIYFTADSLVLCIDLVPSLGSSASFAVPMADIVDALALNPIK